MKKTLLIGIFCCSLIFGSGYSMEKIQPQEQDRLVESDEQFLSRINNCIRNKHDPETVKYQFFYTWFSDYESFSAKDLARLYKLNENGLHTRNRGAIVKVLMKQSKYLRVFNKAVENYLKHDSNDILDIIYPTEVQQNELRIRFENNKKYMESTFRYLINLTHINILFPKLKTINDLKRENTLAHEEKEQIKRELELTKTQYNNLLEQHKGNMIMVKEKLREANNKSEKYAQTINELNNELQDKTKIIEELKKQIEQLKNNNSNSYLQNNNDVILNYFPYNYQH